MSRSKADTLIGLVSQYSPSGQERNAVDWLVARMRTLGYDDVCVDKAGNAVGVIGAGPKQVVLLGHIDTVVGEIPVRVEPSPPAPLPEGERGLMLFGRGSVDAKGPLACFTDAAAAVGAKEGWQFVVVGAVEEERDSDGALFALKQYSPDYAIIGEPNRWDRVALGYKGSAWAEITIKRPQAHTASGEQTAAEAAVEAWKGIQAFAESYNADKKRAFDKLLPTLRGLQSGADAFEQWARLNVGVRLPVKIAPADWYEMLNGLVGKDAVQPLGYAVPAWSCDKNTALVRAFLTAIRGHGGDPRFVFKTGTSDLNIVAPAWKCPALVYGPGDSALDHTPDERISLDEYVKAVDVLSDALSKLVEKGE